MRYEGVSALGLANLRTLESNSDQPTASGAEGAYQARAERAGQARAEGADQSRAWAAACSAELGRGYK